MPQPRTLFYPLSEDSNSSNLAASVSFLPALGALLLFAIFGPLLVIIVPIAWLACKIEGRPFDLFNPIYAELTYEEQRKLFPPINRKS